MLVKIPCVRIYARAWWVSGRRAVQQRCREHVYWEGGESNIITGKQIKKRPFCEEQVDSLIGSIFSFPELYMRTKRESVAARRQCIYIYILVYDRVDQYFLAKEKHGSEGLEERCVVCREASIRMFRAFPRVLKVFIWTGRRTSVYRVCCIKNAFTHLKQQSV